MIHWKQCPWQPEMVKRGHSKSFIVYVALPRNLVLSKGYEPTCVWLLPSSWSYELTLFCNLMVGEILPQWIRSPQYYLLLHDFYLLTYTIVITLLCGLLIISTTFPYFMSQIDYDCVEFIDYWTWQFKSNHMRDYTVTLSSTPAELPTMSVRGMRIARRGEIRGCSE